MRTAFRCPGKVYIITYYIMTYVNHMKPYQHQHSVKGAPARESRTGTRLVSPAASCEKKKLTPVEQGLGTSNLVH